jgi:hypothetical protein
LQVSHRSRAVGRLSTIDDALGSIRVPPMVFGVSPNMFSGGTPEIARVDACAPQNQPQPSLARSLIDHQETSVYMQCLAGNVGAGLGGEEDHRASEVFGDLDPA